MGKVQRLERSGSYPAALGKWETPDYQMVKGEDIVSASGENPEQCLSARGESCDLIRRFRLMVTLVLPRMS